MDSEVVHLKGRSGDTYIGRSPISRAKGAVNDALAVLENSQEFYRNAVAERRPHRTGNDLR